MVNEIKLAFLNNVNNGSHKYRHDGEFLCNLIPIAYHRRRNDNWRDCYRVAAFSAASANRHLPMSEAEKLGGRAFRGVREACHVPHYLANPDHHHLLLRGSCGLYFPYGSRTPEGPA